MPTIIDSLVVTLGLDAKDFNEQQKKAIERLRQLEDAADKHTKPIAKGAKDLTETFKAMHGQLLAIGALIATGLGFNRLVQDVTKLNTELGFTSKALGMTAQQLSQWEQAGRTVGAASGDISQNLAAINREIQEFHATGSSKLQAFMGQVGIKPMQTNDTPDAVAKRLSEWYQGQPNKAFASHLLQSRGGLSQGMINLLSLGPEEIQKRLDQAKRFAPTNEEIQKFTELTKAFGELMNVIDRLTTKALVPFVAALTKILKMLTDWLGKWAENNQSPPEAAGEALGNMGMPELKPNASRPSLFQRSWNWLLGRPGGFSGPSGGGQGANDNAPQARPGTSPDGAGGGGAVGGSDFLRRERQSFTDQMRDPATRQRVAAMAVTEGARDPVPVIESLANRLGYVNSERAKRGLPPVTVEQMLNSGFYGPINRGELPGAISRLNRDPGLASRMNSAIDTVSGGSNITQGFTDQGLPSDPNGWRTPRIARGGNVFNDWNGGGRFSAGDYRNAAAYRERLQAGVAAEGGGATPLRRVIIQKNDADFGSSSTGNQRSFDNWRSLGLGARGAAIRGGEQSSISNSNSSTTNIANMHVTVPPGADPSAYGDGITRRLGEYNNVLSSNTGMV